MLSLLRRGGARSISRALDVPHRARQISSKVPQTNIGYVRLAFNIGAGDHIALRARVFDTPTGQAFIKSLNPKEDGGPYAISSLSTYGDEVYGSWKVTMPSTKPQPMIPPGEPCH